VSLGDLSNLSKPPSVIFKVKFDLTGLESVFEILHIKYQQRPWPPT
jgi:hypothetical protein